MNRIMIKLISKIKDIIRKLFIKNIKSNKIQMMIQTKQINYISVFHFNQIQ